MPLLEAHWSELCTDEYKDILKLDPDWEVYASMQDMGRLRIYTARRDGVLIGYWCFFLNNHPHYRTVKVASGDVLYVSPSQRGIGREFIPWCAEQLKAEGVNFVSCYMKAKKSFGVLMERLGWSLVELDYMKRLN